MKEVARKRLEELAVQATDPVVKVHGHRIVAQAIEIVYTRRYRLMKIVRELRTYCGVLCVLFAVSVARAEAKVDFSISIPEALHEVGENPLEYLGFLELLMIGVFCLRLYIELPELKELVSDE